jgi:Homeodomain-like domain
MPKKSKKYVVRLTDVERCLLEDVVRRFKGTSQKVRRAQVLLKADADGPGWTDAKIADAFGCRTQSVENIRERFVTIGFELTLNGRPHVKPPREKILDGEQEAKVIALRLGVPPPGFSNWSLRLLAEQVVSLEIAESISYETVRRTLKKRDDQAEDRLLGDPTGGGWGIRGQHGRGAGDLCSAV